MTMQPGEIAIEYKQAKNKLKQVNILAELNECPKAEIIRILQEQGVQVDGRLLQTGKKNHRLGPRSSWSLRSSRSPRSSRIPSIIRSIIPAGV